jgi:hypothetical protein
MKPEVYFCCENYQCEQYHKEIRVTKIDTYFIEEYCDKCHHKGKLRFIHKGIETNSAESFYKLVSQMAKEYHLLKRMIDKGVAETADKKRCTEIYEQISGLQCTGCGRDIVLHEH